MALKRSKKKSQQYDEENIALQEGLEGVRFNPSMYLGALGESMVFRMVKEIVDNFYDEYAAGRNTGGEVVYDAKQNSYCVADFAQGIPVGLKQTKHEGKVSTLTLIFTKLHAGGKFNADAYKTSSGTHGVGAAAVNAVSSEFNVWTKRENVWYFQSFTQGVPDAKIKKLGKTVPKALNGLGLKEKPSKYGTVVQFIPDQEVVSEDASRGKRSKKSKDLTIAKLNVPVAVRWLKDLAMLNPKFKITFTYLGKGTKVFENKKGLDWLVTQRVKDNELNSVGKPFVYQDDTLSLAVTWTDHVDDEYFASFVNSSPTIEHGTHVEGFRAALIKAIRPHMTDKDKKAKIGVSDLMIGSCGVLNFRMNSAQYSSQVKDKLVSKVNSEIQTKIEQALIDWFKGNARLAKNILKKATTANQARESLKNVMRSMTEIRKGRKGKLPDNLTEAPNVKPEEREIYLVEGDSAGGTAKHARNSNQEVLALSGKINNSLSTKLDKLLSAQAVINIIVSLGVDPSSLDVNAENPVFKVDKLRCQRVYLLADADPDGSHINVLLLSFFFRLMPDFIREGRLWVVDGSLYSATWKGKVYSGDTREEVAEAMGTKNSVVLSRILRVKGWGEVEPIVLDQDAFNPKTRRVRQIEWTDDPSKIQYFRHIAAESPAHKRELLGLKEA